MTQLQHALRALGDSEAVHWLNVVGMALGTTMVLYAMFGGSRR